MQAQNILVNSQRKLFRLRDLHSNGSNEIMIQSDWLSINKSDLMTGLPNILHKESPNISTRWSLIFDSQNIQTVVHLLLGKSKQLMASGWPEIKRIGAQRRFPISGKSFRYATKIAEKEQNPTFSDIQQKIRSRSFIVRVWISCL